MKSSVKMPTDHRFQNLTGQRFGKWTVLCYAGKTTRTRWLCRCDCGEEKTLAGNTLTTGNSTKCRRCGVRTHGGTGTPEFHAWHAMLGRCCWPSQRMYKYYGARGITVCQRWRHSFPNFLADMGKRSSPKHSLDRIDNDGNYTPENCRWATKKQQTRNTRANRLITFRGRTQPLIAWVEETGLTYNMLSYRLRKGWSVEKALTHPHSHPSRRISH